MDATRRYSDPGSVSQARWRIGQAARRAGVTVDTMRYYERRGLLPPAVRTESGYRLFGPEVVRRVRFIKRAQQLGFSLDEIEELLTLQDDPGATCGEVQTRVVAKLRAIDRKIDQLLRLRARLEELLSQCAGGSEQVSACSVLSALEEEDPEVLG